MITHKKSIFFLLIVFISVGFISCFDSKYPDTYFDRLCSNTSAFTIDSLSRSWIRYTKENNRFLNLRPLSISSDTFCFRIEYNKSESLKIFEFSFYKSKKSFKIYEFPVDKKSNDIIFNKQKDDLKKYEINFDSNLKGRDFISQLKNYKILELPESDTIKGYLHSENDRPYLLEYGNKCRYKIVSYDNVDQNQSITEPKLLRQFLNYLKEEFDF